MVTPVLAVYLAGWVVVTTAALTAARVLADRRRPPTTQSFATVSVIAGAIWPLLLLGAAEIGSLITFAKLRPS